MSRPPLEGLRVLDFTRALAGPFCTRLLVEAGAEVIKIEPLTGDFTRDLIPTLDPGLSGYFYQQNFGKRSVALDLHDGQALGAVLEMAVGADVVVENFRPGVMARLGLSTADLAKVNPRVILCSISGFGQGWHDSRRPGQDVVAQAESGLLLSALNEVDRPILPNASLTDVVTGLHAFNGILAALLRRAESGLGSRVDCSILRSAFQLRERSDDADRGQAAIFACGDSDYIALSTTGSWTDLVSYIAGEGVDEVQALPWLRRWLEGYSLSDALRTLEPIANCEVTRVRTLLELADDREFSAAGIFRQLNGRPEQKLPVTPVGREFLPAGDLTAEPLGASTYWALSQIAGLADDQILDLLGSGSARVAEGSLPANFPSDGPAEPMTSRWVPALPDSRSVLECGSSLAVLEAGRLLSAAGLEVYQQISSYTWRNTGKLRASDAPRRYAAAVSEASAPKLTEAATVVLVEPPIGAASVELHTEAESGLSDIYGTEGGQPYPFGYPVAELVTGGYLAAVTMLSLLAATRPTSPLSRVHSALTIQDTALQQVLLSNGRVYRPRGTSTRTDLVPYGAYKGPDGYLAVAATQGGFNLLAPAIGQAGLLSDPRYATVEDRRKNRSEFTSVLEAWINDQGSVRSAQRLLHEAGVVCAVVRTADEAFADSSYLGESLLVAGENGVLPGPPFMIQELQKRETPLARDCVPAL